MSASASSACEARCLAGPVENTFGFRQAHGNRKEKKGLVTLRTLSVMIWVFGVLRETFRTITLFITTIVVTDITNIRYLQLKVSELILQLSLSRQFIAATEKNLLANQWHCLWRLRHLLCDEEEENGLGQKSSNRHGALLTASCRKHRKLKLGHLFGGSNLYPMRCENV